MLCDQVGHCCFRRPLVLLLGLVFRTRYEEELSMRKIWFSVFFTFCNTLTRRNINEKVERELN